MIADKVVVVRGFAYVKSCAGEEIRIFHPHFNINYIKPHLTSASVKEFYCSGVFLTVARRGKTNA